ncbi:MAG: matrixin family metalloprotease [Thermosynechococcaceae cyanobacterium]
MSATHWKHWPLILGVVVCVVTVLAGHLNSSGTLPSAALAPAPQVHPLPPTLAAWQDSNQQGDYFDQVKPTRAGYLVWSHFPIQVYVGPATAPTPNADEIWQRAVTVALRDWQQYLPLAFTNQPEQADITINQVDPQQRSGNRVRSAETRYRLYVNERHQFAHRSTVTIRPNQTEAYITAAVRHELGHALGIWGHSQSATDALYFSQVPTPPPISPRDINTLKRVYEQPTRLGWPLPSPSLPPQEE